jgi:hypothetical protein
MAILPKTLYLLSANPVIPMTVLTKTKKNLKLLWKHIRSQFAKFILNKKSKDGVITIPDLKLYYRATNKAIKLYPKSLLITVE